MKNLKRIIKSILGYKKYFFNKMEKDSYIKTSIYSNYYKGVEIGVNSRIESRVKIIFDDKTSKLIIKDNVIISESCRFRLKNSSKVIIENGAYINYDVIIKGYSDIIIGKNVMIAPRVSIVAFNHGFNEIDKPMIEQELICKGITIEDNVWIGINSIILDGVTIGKGSIIGAGSVVTKSIGENEVWAGNPARFIKKRI